jgi:hypothetical protein
VSTATYIGREGGLSVRHCSVTYTGGPPGGKNTLPIPGGACAANGWFTSEGRSRRQRPYPLALPPMRYLRAFTLIGRLVHVRGPILMIEAYPVASPVSSPLRGLGLPFAMNGRHRTPQEGRSGWRPARDTLAAGRPVVSVVRVVAAVFSARVARPDRVGGVVRLAVVSGRSDRHGMVHP